MRFLEMEFDIFSPEVKRERERERERERTCSRPLNTLPARSSAANVSPQETTRVVQTLKRRISASKNRPLKEQQRW